VLHSLNGFERIFFAFVRSRGVELQSTNTPEWKALAKRHHVKVPDFGYVTRGGVETLVDVKGSETRDNYVKAKDVDDLSLWRADVTGGAYAVFFAFVHPADDGSFEYEGRRYRIRGLDVAVYRSLMKERSPKWKTVCIPRAAFDGHAIPFENLL